MATPTQKAASKIREWRNDPVRFVREEFGVEPDAWQVDFLHKYNGCPRTAAKACKGPGKTAVLSWCCWHFLVTRPYPKVIATSITGDNLRDGLWAEMAKWQEKSPFLTSAFIWTKTRIYAKDHEKTWFMTARQWSQSADKSQQANALAGLHADYIMFVIDEAGGVPDAVAAAAEAALANAGTEVNPNAEAKLLLCGNPTHLEGPLYRACTLERSEWEVIEITGDPDDPKRSKRISIEWARKQIKSYGADNPWVLINVMGRFPPSSVNALIGPDDMRAAMSRHIDAEAYKREAKVLGIDVARSLALDSSVMFPRQGLVMFKPTIMRIPDLVQVAGRAAQAITKWRPDGVFVDSTGGFGASVVDNLNNWGHMATGVHFAEKALDGQFVNKRAEMAVKFAAWIKAGGVLPNVPELVEEACAVEYFFKGDKLQIIEKDQIKEKIGRSPDLWDAGSLTFAYPVQPKDPHAHLRRPRGEYDPIQRHYGDHGPVNQGMDDYNPIR